MIGIEICKLYVYWFMSSSHMKWKKKEHLVSFHLYEFVFHNWTQSSLPSTLAFPSGWPFSQSVNVSGSKFPNQYQSFPFLSFVAPIQKLPVIPEKMLIDRYISFERHNLKHFVELDFLTFFCRSLCLGRTENKWLNTSTYAYFMILESRNRTQILTRFSY